MVIELFLSGVEQNQIFKTLDQKKFGRSFIFRTLKRFRETGNITDKRRSGRPRSICTAVNKKKVRQVLTRHPALSHRKVAARVKISNASTRRIITKVLGYKSFKRTKTESLTDTVIHKRVQRCRKLLTWLKSVNPKRIVFSDEKIFSIDEKFNSKNSCIYSISRKDIPEQFRTVQKSQHPKSIMVWAGISSIGKTPLVFVPEGTKINAKVYQDLILDKYVRHIGSTFMKGKKWIFQQDGPPAHTAKSTLQWLSSNVPAFLGREEWPPSSPDLNPCDYYLWGRLEAIVNNRAYNDIPSLKRALKRAWEDLDQEEIARACNIFQNRVRCCLKAEGMRFETS